MTAESARREGASTRIVIIWKRASDLASHLHRTAASCQTAHSHSKIQRSHQGHSPLWFPAECRAVSDAPPQTFTNGGWTATAATGRISGQEDLRRIEQELDKPPSLPEMLFGSNSLVMRHNASGVEVRTLRACAACIYQHRTLAELQRQAYRIKRYMYKRCR